MDEIRRQENLLTSSKREIVIGRTAMLGFAAALAVEFASGEPLPDQLSRLLEQGRAMAYSLELPF